MKTMNEIMKAFMEYAVFNESGDLIGIEENAPESAEIAFVKYKALISGANERGMKI